MQPNTDGLGVVPPSTRTDVDAGEQTRAPSTTGPSGRSPGRRHSEHAAAAGSPPSTKAPRSARARSHAAARSAIAKAERDVHAVREEARRQLGEIAARTRAYLESVVTEQVGGEPSTAEGEGSERLFAVAECSRDGSEHSLDAGEHPLDGGERSFEGAVTLVAGPFVDLDCFVEFEDTLRSAPGVAEADILSFADEHVEIELWLDRSTPLAAELHARSAMSLELVESDDDFMYLHVAEVQ